MQSQTHKYDSKEYAIDAHECRISKKLLCTQQAMNLGTGSKQKILKCNFFYDQNYMTQSPDAIAGHALKKKTHRSIDPLAVAFLHLHSEFEF